MNLYRGSLSELFTLPKFLQLKFPLKIFKHHVDPRNSFLQYESFIKFLNQHKTSLTSLKIDFYTDPEFGLGLIHKFALENIVNLKHINMIYFSFEFPEVCNKFYRITCTFTNNKQFGESQIGKSFK